MPKGQKSSASSATRKKHTRKAGGAEQQLPLPKEKKAKDKGKGKNKEPRAKVYIPPTKPTAVKPDPLDSLGIATQLPPELLIVLRLLGKKGTVTKRKALEDLQRDWVEKASRSEDAVIEGALLQSLPVWFHHLPSLLLHPSRRVRLATADLLTFYLRIPSIRDQFVYFLRDLGSSSEVETVLGSWCLATQDVDRQVSASSRSSWVVLFGRVAADPPPTPSTSNGILEFDGTCTDLVLAFVRRSLFDPLAVYLELNPVQPTFIPPSHGSRGRGTRAPPPPPGRPIEDESTSRTRPEDEEESEEDRKGRIRVGALGVLKWFLEKELIPSPVMEILSLPLFWTGLYHGDSPPFMEDVGEGGSLGLDQPVIRKTTWGIILTLVKQHKELTETLVTNLSPAVLRSAWVEPDTGVRSIMWEPLLLFLRQCPQSWLLIMDDQKTKMDKVQNEDDSSEDEEEEDEDDITSTDGAASPNTQARAESNVVGYSATRRSTSDAYREFLQFLQLGCYGSPAQGYPIVVIVLTTIPPTILGNGPEGWNELLESFWNALDGRALSSLDRVQSSAAFLSSLLECIVFLMKRIRSSGQSADGGAEPEAIEPMAVQYFISEQILRVWAALVTAKLRVDEAESGRLLSRTFGSLEALAEDLFSAAWFPIRDSVISSFRSSNTTPSDVSFQIGLLRAVYDSSNNGTARAHSVELLVESLTAEVIGRCVSCIGTEDDERKSALERLTMLIAAFGHSSGCLTDQSLTTRLDELMHRNIRIIMFAASKLLVAYLRVRDDEIACKTLWHDVLITLSSNDVDGVGALAGLLDSSEGNLLPDYLRPDEDELDTLAGRLLAGALSGSSKHLGLASRLMANPAHFISRRSTAGLVHNIAYAFSDKSRAAIREDGASDSSTLLHAPLSLLLQVVKSQPELLLADDVRLFLPDIFVYGYLVNDAVDGTLISEGSSLARHIWTSSLNAADDEQRTDIMKALTNVLRDLISDTDVSIRATTILHVVSDEAKGLSINVLTDLLPSEEKLHDMLQELPADPPDQLLAILDPLVPPVSLWKGDALKHAIYDQSGFSEYARLVFALLTLMVANRPLSRDNIWVLRHFIVLLNAAKDMLNVPSAQSVIFGKIDPSELEGVISRVETLSSFLLSDDIDDSWHTNLVKALTNGHEPSDNDSLGKFVSSVIRKSIQDDSLTQSRVVHYVLKHLFNGASTADADEWMALAKKLEREAPLTSIAIVLAVTESGLEPPKLDRYRNEMAAGVLGMPTSKANSDGLLLLKRLAISAPDADSDVVFLPQTRAVNFVKTCQQWITSDEDVEEDVESEMLVVLLHLAPILQNVSGSHWGFMFDVVENNLENCSFSDQSSLTTLARTLKLIVAIQELTVTNKALRAMWKEREANILTLVRDLVQRATVETTASVPRSLCWELAFVVLQTLPSSLIDEGTLSKMVHLIADPVIAIQKMAYSLLHIAAQRRTEHVVIEAGVDTSEDTTFELPQELLQVLQMLLDNREGNPTDSNTFGYLIGWMIVFDLFKDTSLRVKMSYASQLRDLKLVSSSFLPTIFDLLDLHGGRGRPFPLDMWTVEEYYVQLYDENSDLSAKLLAAHLFYRALLNMPSLVALWWSECKDRQLSTAVANMTARHFSPVLISAELKHVRDPDAAAELSGENWNIKVAGSINEVTASFTVDEEAMEIAIKLPADYPLHSVEVKEIRRLGVDEKKWRGWLLAVQQTVTSQNGRIADGLSMFKRNVTHHFENQTECAICYSIISVTELSLPKKRCRTCKNRFHAGCLYKWFNTSHTSSCPLCRSDFI